MPGREPEIFCGRFRSRKLVRSSVVRLQEKNLSLGFPAFQEKVLGSVFNDDCASVSLPGLLTIITESFEPVISVVARIPFPTIARGQDYVDHLPCRNKVNRL